MLNKTGRQRHYDITPTEGFANREIGFIAASLAELRARVVDQIEDLPKEALDFVHPKIGFTIGQLALHMSWAEVRRLSAVLGNPIDSDLERVLSQGSLSQLGENLPPSREAAELRSIVARCTVVVDELLRPAVDLDRPRDQDGSTLRGVLMHLQWHWSFHSGHVGLIRLLWGSDYTWTMHPPLAPRI